MAAKLKNIMNMQPFEGKFLLFVAEAAEGAQSVIEQGGRETDPVYTDLSVIAEASATDP